MQCNSRNARAASVSGSLLILIAAAGVSCAAEPPTAPPAKLDSPASETAAAFQQNWPGFRGPGGLGIAPEGQWPTSWNAESGENIVWTAPIPHDGKSSPAIWGDRIFLTGADESGHQVACFSRSNGELLWSTGIDPPEGDEINIDEETGFAAPSPVVDGERVYAMFATGLIVALDFDGEPAWRYEVGLPDSTYGFASSPILHQGVLIVQFDQGFDAEAEISVLLGFNSANGDLLWHTPRPVINSWASPAIVPGPNGPELITCAEPWVIAYDPATGEELWRCEGLSGDVAPSPGYGAGLVFATQEYAQLMAIRPGGKGDVTETHLAWVADDGTPDIASPLCDGRRLLQVSSAGQVTCFDAKSGELLWDEFIDSGASASPILAGGLAYIACDDGVTRMLELAGEPRFTGEADIGEPIYATPAFADSRIYIRGASHLFCIGDK